MGALDRRYAGEAGRRLLRWSPPHWEHHDFDGAVSALELPEPRGAARATDKAIYQAMVGALRTLDRSRPLRQGGGALLHHRQRHRRAGRRAVLQAGAQAPQPAPGHRPAPPRELQAGLRPLRQPGAAAGADAHLAGALRGPLPRVAHPHRRGGAGPRPLALGRGGPAPRLRPQGDPGAHRPRRRTTASRPAFDKQRELETREIWLAGSALFLVPRVGGGAGAGRAPAPGAGGRLRGARQAAQGRLHAGREHRPGAPARSGRAASRRR